MGESEGEGIVAGGAGRLFRANRGKIAEIEQRIRAAHAGELANAALVERLKIEAQIRKEVKAEVDKIVPPDALY